MKKRIVVTGAAGFIGSNLCRDLVEKQYDVVAIDNLSAGTLANIPKGLSFIEVDIRSKDLAKYLEGAHTVFHMAAKNCLPDCAANPVETSDINVTGTANVVQACIKANVEHLVYSDTSAEYEGILDFPSKVERIEPLSVYACSKRGGYLAARALCDLHGLALSAVRYFNVYGPAQDWRRVIPPVMSAFTIKLLSRQAPTIYGTGTKRRDFIHVDDVNRFHLKLIEDTAVRGGLFNLGSGANNSILEIYEAIEKIIQSGIKPKFEPELPGEAETTLADTSLTEKTGWKIEVDLQTGLKSFIDYIRPRLGKEIKLDVKKPEKIIASIQSAQTH